MYSFKRVIKKIIPSFILDFRNKKRFLISENLRLNRGKNQFNEKIKIISKNKPIIKQYELLLSKIKIKNNNNFYCYNIDYTNRLYSNECSISNMPINYELCFMSIKKLKKYSNKIDNSLDIFNIINKYLDRLIINLENSESKRNEKLIKYLKNIKTEDNKSFDEALQRILFYNQILWQTNHQLVGLGRLDKILYKFYEHDIQNKIITKEEAFMMIKEFLKTLNNDYCFKSSALLGDTGQLIILGGVDENNKYFCNDLTYLFIDAIKELQLPDPKVLLRVSKGTPRDLFETSLECIKTGIGCPLFANDEVIIPNLISCGYDRKDVYNYVTSACWEPLILGKSFDQNNLMNIIFLEPLNIIIENNIEEINNYDKLIELYTQQMEIYIKNIINEVNNIKFQEDPLMSIFTENCIKNGIDISKGGAKYNNFGLLSLSLSNTVNSLLIIKKHVFEKKSISLVELNNKRKNNLLDKLQIEYRFGSDTKEVIELTQYLMDIVSNELKKYKNSLGGNFKFGLSSPGYISNSENTEASFDGRKANMPYSVHISTDEGISYTELFQFAGKLDYSQNKANGNVIDFFVTPSFIDNNFDKFVDFLMLSTKTGYFEMQMNVVSSDTLIKAKKNPNEFPNLIVRVWGFSAYFNDLPEEYKNLLINRALKSEGKAK